MLVKRFGMKPFFMLMVVIAIGVIAGKHMLGERLVLSTLSIEGDRVRELYLPAKRLAAQHTEIENVAIDNGELLILSKAKYRETAIRLVEQWLQQRDGDVVLNAE